MDKWNMFPLFLYSSAASSQCTEYTATDTQLPLITIKLIYFLVLLFPHSHNTYLHLTYRIVHDKTSYNWSLPTVCCGCTGTSGMRSDNWQLICCLSSDVIQNPNATVNSKLLRVWVVIPPLAPPSHIAVVSYPGTMLHLDSERDEKKIKIFWVL